jgi:fructose-specific phosphotransferase system IIC component
VFNGDAGIILRRKLETNWHILTSNVFTLLVPALVIGFAVVTNRRQGLLAEVQDRQPGLRACLLGSLIAAVVGFAVNDSGIAIPAMMIGMVVPWLIAVALERTP